jgi:hypothetical protein
VWETTRFFNAKARGTYTGLETLLMTLKLGTFSKKAATTGLKYVPLLI